MGKAKLLILFPGVGYHAEKPLLYYAGKLGKKYGYDVVALRYTGFPTDIKGDLSKREEGYRAALQQTIMELTDVDFSEYETPVFVSKSIGTVAAARYAKEKGLPAVQFYLTPLADTFAAAETGQGMAFSGTKDPLTDTEEIKALCAEKNIPLHLVQDANHSLETGDVQTDLKIMQFVMHEIEKYMFQTARPVEGVTAP